MPKRAALWGVAAYDFLVFVRRPHPVLRTTFCRRRGERVRLRAIGSRAIERPNAMRSGRGTKRPSVAQAWECPHPVLRTTFSREREKEQRATLRL